MNDFEVSVSEGISVRLFLRIGGKAWTGVNHDIGCWHRQWCYTRDVSSPLPFQFKYCYKVHVCAMLMAHKLLGQGVIAVVKGRLKKGL